MGFTWYSATNRIRLGPTKRYMQSRHAVLVLEQFKARDMLCSRCLRGLLANGKPSQWSLRPGPLTGAINLLHRRPNSTQSQQHTVENSSSTNNFSSGFVSDCTKPCLDGAVDIPAMSSRDDAEMPPKPLVPLPRPPSPTTTRFFRYTNYCTSSNKPVTVRFANTVGSANWLVSNMTGKVLGFDLEWMPNCPVNVSLVQICDEENILLLHLSQMKGLSLRDSIDIRSFSSCIKNGS